MEEAIEELERIRIEKYFKEKDIKYVATKAEIIQFCIRLLKEIKRWKDDIKRSEEID